MKAAYVVKRKQSINTYTYYFLSWGFQGFLPTGLGGQLGYMPRGGLGGVAQRPSLLAWGSGCLIAATMHEGTITIHIAADVKEIERLNRLVRQFGELHEIPTRTLYAVNLALDELVTNAVLYGYEKADGEKIVVRIAMSEGELVASVEDRGRAFNPLDFAPPPLDVPLADRSVGGLGIHLVRSLMDRLDYLRNDGKNMLTVRKRVR